MKILYVIDTLGSGGKERRLTELLKELMHKQEIEYELVVMSDDIHYEEVYNLGINIHKIIRNTKKDPSVFWKLFRLIKNFKPDIVHCWDSMSAVYVALSCKILKCRLVNGMVIDTPIRQNILNKYWLRSRLTFPFSDIVIGNSRAGLKAYRAPIDRSACVYNGINMSRFEKLADSLQLREEIFGKNSENIFIVGMVAAFEDRKDYSTLIKSSVDLCTKNDRLRVILVGEGKNLNTLKSQVPDSLSDRIVFLGKRTDVESVVNIFNVGVLTTNSNVHGEGISNSIIEYMALAKPVVATIGGGTAEIVIDQETGFLINPSSPGELSNRIETLLNNMPLCNKMGLAGQERIRKGFTIEFMVENYYNIYMQLLSIEKLNL